MDFKGLMRPHSQSGPASSSDSTSDSESKSINLSRPSPPTMSNIYTRKDENASSGSQPSSSTGTPPHRRIETKIGHQRNYSSPTKNTLAESRPPISRDQRRQTVSTPPRTNPYGQQHQQQQPYQPRPFRTNRRQGPVSNPLELRVYCKGLPVKWTTWDIYNFFEKYGTISRIDIYGGRTLENHAAIKFRPAPPDISFADGILRGPGPDGKSHRLEVKNETKQIYMYDSPNTKRKLPERMIVPLAKMDFGAMHDEATMLIMHTSKPTATSPARFTMDLHDKALYAEFSVPVPRVNGGSFVERHYKMRINPSQMQQAALLTLDDDNACLVMTLGLPPIVHRRVGNIQDTHDARSTQWNDNQAWLRQTDIDTNPRGRSNPVRLQKFDCLIDFGRWLTYAFSFSQNALRSPAFHDLTQALTDHNVKIEMNTSIKFNPQFRGNASALWTGMDSTLPAISENSSNPFLADLQHMAHSIHLPFEIRYQLEVCLSIGALHECNIRSDFLEKLLTLEQDRAIKILEKVADSKERYYNPDHIFRLQYQLSLAQRKRASYCIKIPSVVITPSTLYFATPVLEASNRVIRQFRQYENHFLRVKFTDEKYKGRIMSSDDRQLDEVFSRISRTMIYGIQIGDRHYEFLAFGNSQFREHGAYFFASTGSVTAASIRQWMGNFTNIRVIAKYCSRLGQCFSTTRAISHSVTVERIPDVNRNGFCFTDGVGKVSPLVARLIASHFYIKNSDQDYPSMFQFRMAGCKGVLAVEPSLKGMTVQIRPSQEKFPASFYGLEICRISQFSTAYLNVQLILVLSALGVPDEIFVAKQRAMMVGLAEAMTNEHKALALLQKNVDYNSKTITLASMILDGFMETKDPFLISCLRLWRSWSLKYLKEKARIYVEDGAFVLGGVDETAKLRGHIDTMGVLKEATHSSAAQSEDSKIATLPTIFLQVPNHETQGQYRVIEGVCILARNPSLHPGDVRVVRAVDVPALHHMKNVVVLPQTGDRDLANMCSGGDLDGDDYLVIWDQELLPPEWNHPPMDYTSPSPTESTGPVTVADMTKFFVKHIKHDNLSRIAVAHRYWADKLDEGVKDPRCIELAQLHSKAVDYAKTGVEAEFPQHLKVMTWPHWSEPKNKPKPKIHISKRVLGKLYDEVKREPFQAAWKLPFDQRILNATEPSDGMLKDAAEIKALHDEAIRRIMMQQGIKTEFEVFTTFVLEHHQDFNDYKFAEKFGEILSAHRQHFQELCCEKAGTDPQTRDWDKLKPFLVAMYTVTAKEMTEALAESEQTVIRGGREILLRPLTFDTMPLISFPWLFERELGLIATKGAGVSKGNLLPKPKAPPKVDATKQLIDLLGDDFELEPFPEINTATGRVREGNFLDLFHAERGGDKSASAPLIDARAIESNSIPTSSTRKTEIIPPPPSPQIYEIKTPVLEDLDIDRIKGDYEAAGLPVDSRVEEDISAADLDTLAQRSDEAAENSDKKEVDNVWGGEEVGGSWEGEEVEIEVEESALDRLEKLMGTG